MYHLFHRRPAPRDRLALTLALLENGQRSTRALRVLFAWAAEPENRETLELVLDGGLTVDVDSSGEVVLAYRVGEPPVWARAGEMEEVVV